MSRRFCFRCPECDAQAELPMTSLDHPWRCAFDEAELVRDYRAENASIAIANLKKERES